MSSPESRVPSPDGRASPEGRLSPQDFVEKLQEELIALQHMALLGASSAMVAHEFNNLMTPVLTWAQDALNRNDVEAMRKALAKTVTLVQRATAITTHLLGVARSNGSMRFGPQTPEPDTCNVLEAVNDALATMARPLEKDGIQLHLHMAPELRVRMGPLMLHQILLNLLLNARKAMEGIRGSITISAARDADQIVIDVRDTGKGLSAEEIRTRINPFLAADETAHPRDWLNVGLGLAVCRKISHQHHATLEAMANDGPGCTFRLRCPAA